MLVVSTKLVNPHQQFMYCRCCETTTNKKKGKLSNTDDVYNFRY